jgi:hypothetical protein
MGRELHYTPGRGFRVWYPITEVYLNEFVKTPEEVGAVIVRDEETIAKISTSKWFYSVDKGCHFGGRCRDACTCLTPITRLEYVEKVRKRWVRWAEVVLEGKTTVDRAAEGQPGPLDMDDGRDSYPITRARFQESDD